MENVRIVEIKEFDPAYVQVVNQLLDQLTASPVRFTEADLREIIASPGSHLLLLCCGEEMAGMLSLGSYKTPTGRKYWIEDVVVDQNYRGKSLGRALIAYAIRYVERQGDACLMLTSNPARLAANELYTSAGFARKQTNVYKMVFPEKAAKKEC